MTQKTWLDKILGTTLLLGSVCAGIGWFAIFTVKCEGFGCIALGPVAAAMVLAETLALLAGMALIWRRRPAPAPMLWAWVVALALPLLVIIGRNLFR